MNNNIYIYKNKEIIKMKNKNYNDWNNEIKNEDYRN